MIAIAEVDAVICALYIYEAMITITMAATNIVDIILLVNSLLWKILRIHFFL